MTISQRHEINNFVVIKWKGMNFNVYHVTSDVWILLVSLKFVWNSQIMDNINTKIPAKFICTEQKFCKFKNWRWISASHYSGKDWHMSSGKAHQLHDKLYQGSLLLNKSKYDIFWIWNVMNILRHIFNRAKLHSAVLIYLKHMFV